MLKNWQSDKHANIVTLAVVQNVHNQSDRHTNTVTVRTPPGDRQRFKCKAKKKQTKKH